MTGKSPKMTKTEIGYGLHKLAPVIATAWFLAACDDLTRFKQERYECGYNPDGVAEIEFRSFEEGADATVTFSDETVIMPIVESSDARFTLVSEGLIVRVDRASGTVRLTRGTRYRNVKCSKSEFRM